MMMSMTKEGIKGGMMDCKDKSEGLHADISSGCQVIKIFKLIITPIIIHHIEQWTKNCLRVYVYV